MKMANRQMRSVLQARELLNPTLAALQSLGGSARNNEITEQVIKEMRIPDHVAEIPHKNGRMTELEYRLAWARTLLKKYGVIDNLERAVWSLTSEGLRTTTVDPDEVYGRYRDAGISDEGKNEGGIADDDIVELNGSDEANEGWQGELSSTLLSLSPDAFERLCQRILRVSGFIEVEVTGKSGDGGIDGHGIIRLSGLISFPVMFQCKKYAGSVTPSAVRDFRGAMQGRAEKGLILTTGAFTQAAQKEATRDGAPPIDLIDGEALVELLKELKLGVKVTQRTVEDVEVVPEFFESI